MASEALAQPTSETVSGNPDCESLGGTSALQTKIEPISGSGSITEGDITVTPVTLNAEDEWLSFTWTTSPLTLVNTVIVKAGSDAIVYTYSPAVTSDSDPLLTVASFGISHITFCLGAVLPVELTSFETVIDGRDALLIWETASETNNAGFDVQHRYVDDATAAFETLTFVEGHGTTELPQTYRYRVDDVAPGHHAFRLKQIDFDGTFEYSPEVEVAVGIPTAYHLSAAYPNPFNPETQFSLSVARAQQVQVTVYDVVGRRVAGLHDGIIEAQTTQAFRFEAGSLPSGLYLVWVVGERFLTSQTITLVK